jgi:hypothetical protein
MHDVGRRSAALEAKNLWRRSIGDARLGLEPTCSQSHEPPIGISLRFTRLEANDDDLTHLDQWLDDVAWKQRGWHVLGPCKSH